MTAAGAEEQVQLLVLRQRAAATGRELNQTVAALADRLAETASPRRLARGLAHHMAAAAGSRARRAATRATALPARAAARAAALPARTTAPKLALSAGVTTGILVFVAVAVTWQHRRRS
jgi:hypothetical protein